MKLRVGFLTIGQSPRVDVMDDFSKVLSKNIVVVEKGALDGLSKDEIEEKLRPEPGHTVYVSRLIDGSEVKMAKEKVIPLMQKKIKEFEGEKVDVIAILCSGEFPEFESKAPIIYPDKLLKAFVKGIRFKSTLGVLVPLKEQISYAREKWGKYANSLIARNASPYTISEEEFQTIVSELAKHNPSIIVLDCVGYSFKHKKIVREITGKPVISTRGVIARILNEMAE